MTIESDIITTAEERHSYIDWAAIIGGIALASAISLVLLTFGSAIGLGITSFRAGEGAAPVFIAIAAASWLLWVQISSFMAGGYLAGRMRRRAFDATEHESDIRDGVHGLLVWAGSLVVGAIIAAGGVGALANAAGSALATATDAAATVADDTNADGYFADMLLRNPSINSTAIPDGRRDEIGRILAQATATGDVSEADRTYLGQLTASATGLTQDEANARVNEVITSVQTARAEAVQAAETARKWTVLGAFLAAASLLISGVGAYWAAMTGGNHRDRQTVFAGFHRF